MKVVIFVAGLAAGLALAFGAARLGPPPAAAQAQMQKMAPAMAAPMAAPPGALEQFKLGLETRVANLEKRLADLGKALGDTQGASNGLRQRLETLESGVAVGGGTVTLKGSVRVQGSQLEVPGGTLKATTVDVTNVVAKSYTPGAGNVW
ncbi:MAG: hypothetical protein HYV94_14510 [Candidatus Rokubacteria bacterium]|nr:hypothetical protein [Candidatus Rokubacteria bacterium]